MELRFGGELWYWKGPAPWYFVTVPEEESIDIEAISRDVTYGWGMIPVTVRVGSSTWATALFPKDGRYIVPIKADVRRKQQLELGERVAVRLTIQG
jgi:hypothetical protein